LQTIKQAGMVWGMNFTSTKLADGKFEIARDGVALRKKASKTYSHAYVYSPEWIRFAPDSQLRRLMGEPKIFEITQK
jgi:hypothetical protein